MMTPLLAQAVRRARLCPAPVPSAPAAPAAPLKLTWRPPMLVEVIAPGPPSIRRIQVVVCDRYRLTLGDLIGPSRSRGGRGPDVVTPRQVAMYLCYEMLGERWGRPYIGSRFGRRDATTVLAACRKITRLRTTDAALDATLTELERELRGS